MDYNNENLDSVSEDYEEVADPQSQEDIEDYEYMSGFDEESEKDEEIAEPQQKKQDKDIDAAFAKMRRELEQTQKALMERDKWLAENFKDFGISSWDDYKAKMEQQLQEQRQQEIAEREEALREAGYDPDIIKQIVEPELNAIKQENEQLKAVIQQEVENQRMLNEYNDLRKEFSQFVKTPEDIPPEVWEMYEKGTPLVKAFKAVKHDEIVKYTKESSRQKTLNNLNSKQHLKVEGSTGDTNEDVHVPNEVLDMYLDMGLSKKEAYAHYKRLYK